MKNTKDILKYLDISVTISFTWEMRDCFGGWETRVGNLILEHNKVKLSNLRQSHVIQNNLSSLSLFLSSVLNTVLHNFQFHNFPDTFSKILI